MRTSSEPERRSTSPGLSYHDWHTLGALVKRQLLPGLLAVEKRLRSILHYEFDLVPPQPEKMYKSAGRILSLHIAYLQPLLLIFFVET